MWPVIPRLTAGGAAATDIGQLCGLTNAFVLEAKAAPEDGQCVSLLPVRAWRTWIDYLAVEF